MKLKKHTNLEVTLAVVFAIAVLFVVRYCKQSAGDVSSHQAEINRCVDSARLSSSTPSSVELAVPGFFPVTDSAGNLVLESAFLVKNSEGVETKQVIRCVFQPTGEMEASITDPP